MKPDLVITEKGLSGKWKLREKCVMEVAWGWVWQVAMAMLSPCTDLAQHYLSKNNISALRRVRKTDNNRIARACGATIVNRTDEIKEEDVGTGCGLFEVRKIGDEYFTYLVDCKDPKACSIVLRGASKDILNEVWCHGSITCLASLWHLVLT